MSATLRDRIAGTALLAVALVWIVLVYQTIPPNQGPEVGPRGFPLFFGIVLAVMSLVLLAQGFRARPEATDEDSVPAPPGEATAVILTIVGLVAYGMLLEPFGFMPSTAFIVVVILYLVLRVRSLLLIGSMAIGLSLGCYLVFGKLLGTYLPPGHIITIYF